MKHQGRRSKTGSIRHSKKHIKKERRVDDDGIPFDSSERDLPRKKRARMDASPDDDNGTRKIRNAEGDPWGAMPKSMMLPESLKSKSSTSSAPITINNVPNQRADHSKSIRSVSSTKFVPSAIRQGESLRSYSLRIDNEARTAIYKSSKRDSRSVQKGKDFFQKRKEKSRIAREEKEIEEENERQWVDNVKFGEVVQAPLRIPKTKQTSVKKKISSEDRNREIARLEAIEQYKALKRRRRATS